MKSYWCNILSLSLLTLHSASDYSQIARVTLAIGLLLCLRLLGLLHSAWRGVASRLLSSSFVVHVAVVVGGGRFVG